MFLPAPNLNGCITLPASPLANVLTVDAESYALVEALLGDTGNDWTYIRMGQPGNYEYMRVTSALGAVITVDRGIDGTVGTAYPASTEFEYILTAQAVQDVVNTVPGVVVPELQVDPPLYIDYSDPDNPYIYLDLVIKSTDGSIDVMGDTYDGFDLAVTRGANGCC